MFDSTFDSIFEKKFQKRRVYRDNKIRLTQFRETSKRGKKYHGFFTEFQKESSFLNQVRSPLVIPIVCAVTAAQAILEALKDFTIAFFSFNVHQFFDQLVNTVGNLFTAFCYLVFGVVDTAQEVLSLATRMITSFVVHCIQDQDEEKLEASKSTDTNSTESKLLNRDGGRDKTLVGEATDDGWSSSDDLLCHDWVNGDPYASVEENSDHRQTNSSFSSTL